VQERLEALLLDRSRLAVPALLEAEMESAVSLSQRMRRHRAGLRRLRQLRQHEADQDAQHDSRCGQPGDRCELAMVEHSDTTPPDTYIAPNRRYCAQFRRLYVESPDTAAILV